MLGPSSVARHVVVLLGALASVTVISVKSRAMVEAKARVLAHATGGSVLQ